MYSILCIDDERDNLAVLTSLLKDEYRVYVAKSGQDGLALVKTVQPDLILLDVIMPEMDGFAVISELKADQETLDIPVIFITGLQRPEDEEKGLQLGACDYIQKPFHDGIVKQRIANHLELVKQRNLLSELALVDVLTELPNRRKWQIESEFLWHRAIKQQHKVAVGVVDIDCFKLYNDHFGHSEGDVALKEVGQALQHKLQQVGSKAYRLGGEEFVFMLAYNDDDDFLNELATIPAAVSALELYHPMSKVTDKVTVSVGVALCEATDQLLLSEVFNCADKFMYKAKRTGGNQLVLDHIRVVCE